MHGLACKFEARRLTCSCIKSTFLVFQSKMRSKYHIVVTTIVIVLSILNVASGAVAHSHSHKRSPSPSRERETDGAYSPRDVKHQDSNGEHRSEFDHEAILGKRFMFMRKIISYHLVSDV